MRWTVALATPVSTEVEIARPIQGRHDYPANNASRVLSAGGVSHFVMACADHGLYGAYFNDAPDSDRFFMLT